MKKTFLNNSVDFKMSKEDIGLLAQMCSGCYMFVSKGIFSGKYAYYIPNNESDLTLAKEIFNRNNIDMQVHKSRIRNDLGEYVLRVKYNNGLNDVFIKDTMSSIYQKHIDLYSICNTKMKEERQMLRQKILELKQMQKQ